MRAKVENRNGEKLFSFLLSFHRKLKVNVLLRFNIIGPMLLENCLENIWKIDTWKCIQWGNCWNIYLLKVVECRWIELVNQWVKSVGGIGRQETRRKHDFSALKKKNEEDDWREKQVFEDMHDGNGFSAFNNNVTDGFITWTGTGTESHQPMGWANRLGPKDGHEEWCFSRD